MQRKLGKDRSSVRSYKEDKVMKYSTMKGKKKKLMEKKMNPQSLADLLQYLMKELFLR